MTKTKKVQTFTPEPAPTTMLAVIERVAADPRCNIEKMRAILEMQMELKRDDSRVAYSAAMRAAQSEMMPVVRNAENSHTRSKYAKLEHIDHEVRPIYTKHGFSLSFDSRKEADGTITMLVDVSHDGGHTVTRQLNGGIDISGAKGTANKTEIQGVGSSVSYLKRQLVCMVFNIVLKDKDDDGCGVGAKDKAKPDPFKDKMNAQSSGTIIEAEVEDVWDQRTIVVGGKLHTPPGGKKFSSILLGGQALKAYMLKAKTPAEAGEVLLANLPLVRALGEAGLEELVGELHTIGGSNGQN